MKHEKSCGAVVFAKSDGALLVLVEDMRQGHVSLPKGHVENGETESQTAEREILEETGLHVRVDTGFRRKVTYRPAPYVIKDVVFFVALTDSMDTRNQEEEVSGIRFLPVEDAIRALTFQSDRDVARAAHDYMTEKLGLKG